MESSRSQATGLLPRRCSKSKPGSTSRQLLHFEEVEVAGGDAVVVVVAEGGGFVVGGLTFEAEGEVHSGTTHGVQVVAGVVRPPPQLRTP